MAEREIERWVTIHGVHVPIYAGDSDETVKNRLIAKQNEYKKQKDIWEHELTSGPYGHKVDTKKIPKSPFYLNFKNSKGEPSNRPLDVEKETKKFILFKKSVGGAQHRLNKETGEVETYMYNKWNKNKDFYISV